MMRFRWWLFMKLSVVGWWVCPEPYRSVMHRLFDLRWEEVDKALKEGEREN